MWKCKECGGTDFIEEISGGSQRVYLIKMEILKKYMIKTLNIVIYIVLNAIKVVKA